MNKPQPEAFDLEAALDALETSPLGERMRFAAGESDPAAPTVQRIQQRLERTVGAREAARPSIAATLRRWRELPRLPRLAGAMSLLLIAALAATALFGGRHASTASAAELLQRAEHYAGRTVEPGKVRHIVRQTSSHGTNGDQDYTEEIWLAQGQDHLLVALPLRQFTPGSAQIDFLEGQIVDENYVWTIAPDGRSVIRSPFDACSLDLPQWIGDAQFLADVRQSADFKLIGSDVIDGRPVEIVEVYDARIWIDAETGQIVQFKSDFTYEETHTETTYRVTLDQTIDAAAAPADLFTFKLPAGATVEEQATPRCSNG